MGKVSVFDTWRDEVVARLHGTRAKRRLQELLEGNALPPIDNYTEGHTWLLEVVKDLPQLKDRLAVLSAQLIESHVRKTIKSEDPARLLFNLLFFCAQLRQPSTLWKPLLQMFHKRAVPTANDVSGEYQGVSFVAALCAALAGNQGDGRMLVVWRAMLENKPDRYLHGTPMDGFEGVMGVPGKPQEPLIGWAFARLSDYLDGSPFRIQQFRQLLSAAKSRYNDYPWDFELLAARCQWKQWSQKLVGAPSKLIKIEYVRVEKVEYLKGNTKPRIRIRLPMKYKIFAAKLDPTIRQLALDFCKAPPPDGTLVPLIVHLLPSDKNVLSKRHLGTEKWTEQNKSVSASFTPVVQSLRKNEAA